MKPTYNYHSEFFKLKLKVQKDLRIYMAFLNAVYLVQFLLSGNIGSMYLIIGISINLAIIYFSIFIQKAPNLYFQIIPISFWIVLFFSILDPLGNLAMYHAVSGTHIANIICISIALIFMKSIMQYRNSITKNKRGIFVGCFFVGAIILFALMSPYISRQDTNKYKMQVKDLTGVILPEIPSFFASQKPFHKKNYVYIPFSNFATHHTILFFISDKTVITNVEELSKKMGKRWDMRMDESSKDVIQLGNGQLIDVESIKFTNKSVRQRNRGIQCSIKIKQKNCYIIIYTDSKKTLDTKLMPYILNSLIELN